MRQFVIKKSGSWTLNLKNDLKNHLIDLIDFDGAGYTDKENTLKEAANTLWNECANYNRGTTSNKFKEALQGLPSYINIPFYNGHIIDLMYALGYEDTDEVRTVETYWSLCGEILADEFSKE